MGAGQREGLLLRVAEADAGHVGVAPRDEGQQHRAAVHIEEDAVDGSISIAGEWTLHTSARHQRAGCFSLSSGVRVAFSSSQQALAAASEWLPSPTASVRGFAPLAWGYLASKAS